MLSNKVQLVVVDIDGQRLVLSVADSGATVLHTSAHPADDLPQQPLKKSPQTLLSRLNQSRLHQTSP